MTNVTPLKPFVHLTLLVSAILILLCPDSHAAQTGSWGDQGDGTYRNPVLESNYPDNDVIQVGDTFYMMSSTNHLSPGMVVLKSKDLVNWEFCNYILPSPLTYTDAFEISPPPTIANLGTWAGSFGYNGETYFAYWCYNDKSLHPGLDRSLAMYYSTAKSMEGPWSAPQQITWPDGSSINTTDPGVFWDHETHKAYMGIQTDETTQIFEMSWDGSRMINSLEEGIFVTEDFVGEAVKIHKFDGVYYLTNAHWRLHEGVQQRMGVIHRAPSIEGPWEGRLALENGNGTDRSPSQGSLLRLKDGSWWFIHQLARGKPAQRYNGRPQILEPVSWKDGWPMIGVDTDGDGIGEVVWHHEKPIQGHPVTAPASDDDFSSNKLGLQWSWRFNPQDARWSLTERPGFLRLKSTVRLTRNPQGSLNQLPNLLAQRLMGRHENIMTAKFDLSGMVPGQESGFHISAIANHWIGVEKSTDGDFQLFFKTHPLKKSVSRTQGPVINQTDIWFRATIDDGLARFFYSLDGNRYLSLGDETRLLFIGFTPNRIGFFSMNDSENGHVDIDWFTYDYDGPKE